MITVNIKRIFECKNFLEQTTRSDCANKAFHTFSRESLGERNVVLTKPSVFKRKAQRKKGFIRPTVPMILLHSAVGLESACGTH
ncbi:hypothetical protein V3C99_010972 [Haemonchus contortus]